MLSYAGLLGTLLVAAKVASAGQLQLFPFSASCNAPGANVDGIHTAAGIIEDRCLIYDENTAADLYSVGMAGLDFNCQDGRTPAFFGFTNPNCADPIVPAFSMVVNGDGDCYDFGGQSFQSFKFHCCNGPVTDTGCEVRITVQGQAP